jgi:hypothetical protein
MNNVESLWVILQLGGAALFSVAIIVGFFMGIVPAEAFTGIAGGVIGYIFSDRKSSKEMQATVLALKEASTPTIVRDEKEI